MTRRRASVRASILAMVVGYLSILSPAVSAQFVYRRPVIINVGDDWQTKIDAAATGQPFLIKAGTHRFQSVNPKAGQAFVGEAGAIMSGARVLTSGSFVTSGGHWKIAGQTQTGGSRVGSCQLTLVDNPSGTIDWATSYPGCDYPEEAFRDGVRLLHKTTATALASGEWYFDYAADEIHVGDDPSGHTIETSITTTAFNPTADNVRIQNLTIEKYASVAQYGAINAEGSIGWVVSNCLLRLNHSGGIRIGTRLRLSRNVITRNGQEGVVGIGDNVIVEDNEISYNNGAHFDPGWEAGGTKFVQTYGLVVQRNWVHHNEGPGLWGDIDNINALLESNVVEDNDQMGIFWEISYYAVIRYNTVSRNGLAYWVPDYVWGVGILVAASPDVEVGGNTLVGNRGGIAGVQQSRGSGTFGAHVITSLNVHDNFITIDVASGTPTWNGLVDDTGSSTIFTSDNNHFESNTYTLKTNTNYFVWSNVGDRSFSSWNSFGHDTPIGSASTF